MSRVLVFACVLLALGAAAWAAESPGWTVIDARWRPDANGFAKAQVWQTEQWREGWNYKEQFWPKHFRPAGSVHVIMRNDTGKAQEITLDQVNGQPLQDILTNLKRAGSVIWYRVDCPQLPITEASGGRLDVQKQVVPPGEWFECVVRLRSVPTSPVKLKFKTTEGGEFEAAVAPKQPAARLESVAFSPKIDRIYIYVRSRDSATVRRGTVLLDGKETHGACPWTVGPKGSGLTVAEVRLDPPWKYGSAHLVEVALMDGVRLAQPVKAWDCFFSIGMIGASGKANVLGAKEKGFNTYYWSDPTEPFAAGMNQIPSRDWGQARPRTLEQCGVLFNYNWDEPDCHDWTWGKELPAMDRLGVLAEQIVLPIIRVQRKNDPITPTLILADNTYKPLNWYVYGQLADVYATDPYVLLGGGQVEYVQRVLDVARDASTPRPLISVLWANGFEFDKGHEDDPRSGEGDTKYRAPSPEEERMMVFYSVGAGCKGVGYFCDFPDDPNMIQKDNGHWLHLSMNKPLYEEVGRINRDLAALAPYVSIGCPVPGIEGDKDVYISELMCGPDSVVVVVVNRDHHIAYLTRGEIAFHITLKDVRVDIPLPAGFDDCVVREVKDGALVEAAGKISKGMLKMNLDAVDSARAFVVSKR